MPLSEQERRALEELEAQLSAEDPKFASTMVADPHARRKRRQLLMGVAAVVLGLGLVLLAVSLKQPWIGAFGFVAMVLGVAHAASPGRGPDLRVVGSPSGGRARTPQQGKPHGNSEFMARLEERWERRRRQNQGW